MIEYTRTDIFTSRAQTLVNPVNSVGVMGAGLAACFRRRHPGMFEAYRRHCLSGAFSIGKLWVYRRSNPWVLCFPTKRHYRDASSLSYIDAGLANLRASYRDQGITSLAMPTLGCGLGRLAWPDVRLRIEAALGDLDLPVFIHVWG